MRACPPLPHAPRQPCSARRAGRSVLGGPLKGVVGDLLPAALVYTEGLGLSGPLLAKRLWGQVFQHVASARPKRSSTHHLAAPDRVAPTDEAGVAAPAPLRQVATVGVVGEQLVALTATEQPVPVEVEGVGVYNIAPILAVYVVALVGAYALVEHVVVACAVTGDVMARFRDGHCHASSHKDA